MGKCFVGSYPAEDFFPENFILAFNTYRYTRGQPEIHIQALNYCRAYIQL